MKNVIVILISVVVLGVVWYLASPLFINNKVGDDLPEEFLDYTDTQTSEVPENIEVDEKMSEEMKEASLIKSGEFMDADNAHKGSGMAKILSSIDSSLLRFEDFSVTNGPQLHVLLSTNPNPTDSDSLGQYVDLGGLKGNVGNQNYILPNDLDISMYNSVVIYCKPFSVVFSVASLQ